MGEDAPVAYGGKESRDVPAGRRKSLSSGLGYGGLSFINNAAIALVSSIVIARIYGIDVVGKFALVSAPTAVLWQLSTVKEQIAFVREVSMYEPRAPRITGMFWAMFSFSTALTTLVAGLAAIGVEILYRGPVDRPDLIAPALASLAAYLLVTNVGWNLDSVFAAFRAGRELNLVRLQQALVFLALVVVGAEIAKSVWILVAATALSQATSLAQRVFYLPRYMALTTSSAEMRAGFSHLPEFIRFGFKVAGGDLANGISREIGIWVLSVSQSIATLGAYSRAWLISTRLIDFNYRITEMLFPTLVERHERGEREGFDRALADTMRYSAVVLLLPAAVGGGAAHGVMAIYGAEFTRASDALALTLLVPTMATLASIQRQPLLAIGRPVAASLCSVAGLAVTAGATVIAVDRMGLNGAAVGVLLGSVASLLLASILASKATSSATRKLWPLRQQAALLIAYASGFSIARAIDQTLGSFLGLLLALTAGTVAYIATFWLARGVTAADRNRLVQVRATWSARAKTV